MTTTRGSFRHVRLALLLGALVSPLAAPPPAGAQLIPIKTVPIAEGDQYGFVPSSNFGMGGVTLALHDTLHDAFVNPALAARVKRGAFFGSPTFYDITYGAGGGRTLPLGAIARRGNSFGGVMLALQQVDPSRQAQPQFFPPGVFALGGVGGVTDVPQPVQPQKNENNYAFALAGHSWQNGALSLAASAEYDGLHAIDGVDLLYAGSQSVRQRGSAVDLRLGLLKEWEGDRSLQALVLHNRFAMAHDVSYVDAFWDPTLRQTRFTARKDHNLDHTNTWGMHVAYQRPVGDSGWHIGGVVTANRLSHPKIPNYQIQQVQSIPRDPGTSYAYNFGVGVSHTDGPATFGLDVIFEPIWSHTWDESPSEVQQVGLGVIPVGGRTIDNHFRFANAVVRSGVSRDIELDRGRSSARFQLGIDMRSISYWLDQWSYVQRSGRAQEQHWVEWTPTWGLSFRFPELELRYQGRSTRGTGRPGVRVDNNTFVLSAADSRSSFLAAPNGPLTLDDVHVTTHQISIALPIR